MSTWSMATRNIAGARRQQEIRHPLDQVVRAYARFLYRPEIVCEQCSHLSGSYRASAHALAHPGQVCTRPQRTYEARLELELTEERASRVAPVQHTAAKQALEALQLAACHFTQSNDLGTDRTTTSPAAPYPFNSPTPRPTHNSQVSGCPKSNPVEDTP